MKVFRFIAAFLVTLLLPSLSHCDGTDFISVEVTESNGKKVCLYVSKYNVTGGIQSGPNLANNATATCASIGLPTAYINSTTLKDALSNLMSCQMSEVPEKVLVGPNGVSPAVTFSHYCFFYFRVDQTFQSSNTTNCTDKHYRVVCRKDAACNSGADVTNAVQTYSVLPKPVSYTEASVICPNAGGRLPVVTTRGRAAFLTASPMWIGLKPIAPCTNSSCLSLSSPMVWQNTNPVSNLSSTLFLTSSLIVSNNGASFNCLSVRATGTSYMIDNSLACSTTLNTFCEFDSPILPTNPAGFYSQGLVCSSLPTIPATSKLGTSYKTFPICAGTVVNYICNTTGINAFASDVTQNSTTATCSGGGTTIPTFQVPNPWPTCVPYLNCSSPPIDPLVMSYDWTDAKLTMPGLSVNYTCLWPKKYVISKDDLANLNAANIKKSINTTCLATGVYNIDMTNYVCTKPCPIPISPNPSLMYHNWTNTTQNAEFGDELVYTCLNNQTFVTKADFAIGSPASISTNLYAFCLISGWFNDTAGSHTCTKNCDPPYNYSIIMSNNWHNVSVIPYGTTYRYTCNVASKLIVDLTNPSLTLVNYVNSTCLVNGQYSVNITNYWCIDCNRPSNPSNGHFECSSLSYATGSFCTLVCDPGYVPSTKNSMTCSLTASGTSFDWDVPFSEFKCVQPCHLVIGGMANDTSYIPDVEVFCPNNPVCKTLPFASLPYGILGPSGGFTNGLAFVCGGAMATYTGCVTKSDGNHCARNAECVSTLGGSLWCTGPKTTTCFKYDRYLTQTWIPVPAQLNTARAYGTSVSLPDGRIWILGGAGSTNVLSSTEFVSVLNDQIEPITTGPDMMDPLMGHCAAVLSISQVIVAGGFSSTLGDFSPNAYIYDFNTEVWTSSPLLSPGIRIDSACKSLPFSGTQRVVFASGWNNTAMTDTAIFSTAAQKWTNIDSSVVGQTTVPYPLRSSAMVEEQGTGVLVGGVICNSQSRQCQQTNKVMQFSTNLANGTWTEMTTWGLAQPRSSHIVLTVPRTMIPRC